MERVDRNGSKAGRVGARGACVAAALAMAAGCTGVAPAGSGGGSGGNEGVGNTDGHPKEPGKPPPWSPPPGKAPECSVTSEASLGTGEAVSPVVAFAAGKFVTVWAEDGKLQTAVIDERGNASAPRALPTLPGAAEPSVASLQGGGFMVVWQEPAAVRALRLAADGSPSGSPFTVAQAVGDLRPSVASAGDPEVAWADTAGVSVATLQATTVGARIAFPGASDPALASGDPLGLVFVAGNKLGFARLGRPLKSVDPVLFRDAPGKANVPRASAAGDGFFVAWEDDRGGNDHETVLVTRVGADGKPGAEVTVPPEAGSANYPDVATLGGYAAVAYYQFRDGPSAVYLSLFGPDLHRAGDELRISGKGGRTPRIASGNGALGVVHAHKGGPARFALVSCH